MFFKWNNLVHQKYRERKPNPCDFQGNELVLVSGGFVTGLWSSSTGVCWCGLANYMSRCRLATTHTSCSPSKSRGVMAVLCKRVQATSKATAAMQSQWCCYWPSDWIVGVVAMDCETRSRQWDEDLLCLQQWCWRLVMMVIGDIDLLQVLSGGVVCLMSLQHLATGYWLIFFSSVWIKSVW